MCVAPCRARVVQRVGEDEASLGVGVDDLDRLPVRSAQDVAGPVRVRRPARSRSTATTVSTRSGQAELGDRGRRLDHRCAAAHVALHVLHAQGGLQRDAARVEGDRLADQPERGASLPRPAGRSAGRSAAAPGAARRDGGERAHALGLDPLAAVRLDRRGAACCRSSACRASATGVSSFGGRFARSRGAVDVLRDDRLPLREGVQRPGRRRAQARSRAGPRSRSCGARCRTRRRPSPRRARAPGRPARARDASVTRQAIVPPVRRSDRAASAADCLRPSSPSGRGVADEQPRAVTNDLAAGQITVDLRDDIAVCSLPELQPHIGRRC